MRTREQIVELDKRLIWHPYTPMKRYIEETDPMVAERAEGIYLFDRDGTRFVDGNSSWWTNIIGHRHPRLMDALRRQLDRMDHCSLAGTIHEPAVELAERLLPMCGPSAARLFFSDDGSTAVEVGVRMAYQHWQLCDRPEKNRFVTLSGAFHGETVGAASVSGGEVFHEAIGPLLFDCIRLPSPARKALPEEAGDGPWYERAFELAEEILRGASGEIAAVIVEPLVQGAAGMLMYPPEYLARMHRLCQDLDILLIADEVFVGYGRTGTFLAHQQGGFEADIICLAKGFSGGVLPMAGTVASERVFEPFAGGAEATLWYGHSFTGNPLGAVVAHEVLAVLEEERLIEGLGPKVEAMARGLATAAEHPWARDPRHKGMIAAFTLVDPAAGGGEADYLSDAGWRFYAEARKRGALLRPMGNVVYFVLPLTITVEQIDDLFGVVHESLAAAFG